MREPLTDRQREIYDYIEDYTLAYRTPPTVREIGEAFGGINVSAVRQHQAALVKRGWLHPHQRNGKTVYVPRVIETDFTCAHCGEVSSSIETIEPCE